MSMPIATPQLPGDMTPALARLFGPRLAVRDRSRAENALELTYQDLAEATARAATALVALGVNAGDRVCLLAKNRSETISLLFACGRLGAIFVPLNWRLKEPELAFLVEDADPAVLIFDRDLAFLAGALTRSAGKTRGAKDRETPVAVRLDPPQAPPDRESDADTTLDTTLDAPLFGDLCRAAGSAEPNGGRHAGPPQAPVTADDPWLILYTSGTTGHPKGALLPYRQVLANAFNTHLALDLTSQDSTITFTPFFHTGALHVLTTPLLMRGATVTVFEGFDASKIIDTVAEGHCSILFGVPTTFEMLANHPRFAAADFSNVRLALCGGAPCPRSLIDRYLERDVVFKQGYGLTEVGPNCLNLNPEDVLRKAGSAGRENALIIAKRADDGELLLAGPCTCLGYWRRPDATAAAFTSDGYFRTGDIVEIDDEGYFSIVDRKKDMFISGGENVYPAEVERVLGDHPLVGAVAVVGIEDDKWGEVGRAYLELRAAAPGPTVEVTKTIRDWAKDRLAGFKMPKEFVVAAALPRNASGKVQKHLLSKSQSKSPAETGTPALKLVVNEANS